MNFLNINLKKLITILFVISLPLVSINTQQNSLNTGWYDRPFSFLASMTQQGFYAFSDGVRSTTLLYLDLINLKKESARLKSENFELLTRLEAMTELKSENDRLHQLFDFKTASKMDLIAARIMSKDLVSDHNTIQINKGTRHGLKSGQAVITINGVVGYVFKPEPFTSQVLLITDRYSVVDGIVSRSRARGIVEGKNNSSCAMRYVEKSEDIKEGDIIVTSGLDNIFPKGFPVATVVAVENKAYSVSLRVDLKPIVDPDKIEEVFVVLNAANEDLSEKLAINTEATDPAAIKVDAKTDVKKSNEPEKINR